MKSKLKLSENLLVGSLLFGLFFGAGNLIFPLELGQKSGSNLGYLTIGFLISAVSLPILAVVATAASDSESLFELSRPAGKKFAYFFTSLLYLTIGPGFAIPRTASTSYEVIFKNSGDFYSWASLFAFSLIFFILVYLLAVKKASLIDTIGKYLTPCFLILLSILLLLTIFFPAGSPGQAIFDGYKQNPLSTGFIEGYNTLDAPAGLAFSIVVVENIKALGIKNEMSMAKEVLKSSLVCLVSMSIIYAGLAYMGSISVNILSSYENGAVILSSIAKYYLGALGFAVLSVIVFIACLKTAIGLVSACSEMFEKILDGKISYRRLCLIFSLVSLLIANLGLTKIISLSLPVLMFIYPISIMLIVLSILSIFFGKRRFVYKFSLAVTSIFAFLDFLRTLPEPIRGNNFIAMILDFCQRFLPGFDQGFAWILPAILSIIVAYLIDRKYALN